MAAAMQAMFAYQQQLSATNPHNQNATSIPGFNPFSWQMPNPFSMPTLNVDPMQPIQLNSNVAAFYVPPMSCVEATQNANSNENAADDQQMADQSSFAVPMQVAE